MAAKSEYKKIMTPAFRVSFPHLAEPMPGPDGGIAKFAVKMLFPKSEKDVPEKLRNLPGSATIAEIKKLCADVATAYWKDGLPKTLKKPFRDGDTETEYAEDKGMLVASARTTKKPGIINGANREMTTKEEIEERFYAGCWARATIAVGATETGGNRCVHFVLNNLQKLKDDAKFGNRKSAKEEFETVAGFEDSSAGEAERDFSANDF